MESPRNLPEETVELDKDVFSMDEITDMINNPNYTVFTCILEDFKRKNSLKLMEDGKKQVMIFVTVEFLRMFLLDRVRVKLI
jgi:hypothetical protein